MMCTDNSTIVTIKGFNKMQLNKKLKRLLLASIIMAVSTACNSKKNNYNTIDTENNAINSNDNASLTVKQLAISQIQELKNNNTVYFDFDKYDITSEYTKMLDQHAAFLRINPSVKITLEGHTDEKGTSEYNIALGERRANSVKIYLQSKGVNSEHIAIISYGKEKPAVQGNNESIYTKNRRAILVY